MSGRKKEEDRKQGELEKVMESMILLRNRKPFLKDSTEPYTAIKATADIISFNRGKLIRL
jgi:hypothetical protein